MPSRSRESKVPRWVVEALRRNCDEGWPIPAPRTRQIGMTGRDRPIDIEHYTSGAYGDLFRRGSDTSGLEDCFIEREEGTFGWSSAGALAPTPEESYVQGESFTETDAVIAEANASANCPPPESADDEHTRQVQAELRMRCGRQRGPLIAGLRVHVAGDATLLICATVDDMAIVQRELIGALQHILRRLGVPPQPIFTTQAGWDLRRDGVGNPRCGTTLINGVPLSV